MSTRQIVTLVRREFWEHRVLWTTPLILAAVLILFAVLGTLGNTHVFNGDMFDGHGHDGESNAAVISVFSQLAVAVPQLVVMSFVVVFYLLDCLSAERKDRSILFWKSLPVSDASTVLSKFLVAFAVVPLGVYAVAVVTNLLCLVVVGISPLRGLLSAWDASMWFETEALLLFAVIYGALWYAPVMAWLLLVSSWAKRSPITWALLPPSLGVFVEHNVIGTDYLGRLLSYRLVGFWKELNHESGLNIARDHFGASGFVSFIGEFGHLWMWVGLAAAAGLLYGAIRIRRRHDDT